MISHRFLIFCLSALFVALLTPLQAEDWLTTDGKAYHQVKVVKAERDAVTILHRDGGALVPLDKLPRDLQKRFHYDPAQAKVAAEARAQSDATSAVALQAERRIVEQQKEELDGASQYATASDSPAPVFINSGLEAGNDPLAAPGDVNHHAMGELVDVHQRLRDADLGPDHHYMAGLASTMHTLADDSSNANHHSMSDLFPGQ